jgi:hypothetical protein
MTTKTDTPCTDERTYPADCLGNTLVVNADWAREIERENAALREKVDDWENAVAHALDHRPDEQHCTCVAPLVGKVQQLERENATLREILDLAFRIPNMTDAELAELIRNCRAARKEQP